MTNVRKTSKKYSVQFSSVTQLCLTLCDPMNRSTPGLPVHHPLQEFTQTHVHRIMYELMKVLLTVMCSVLWRAFHDTMEETCNLSVLLRYCIQTWHWVVPSPKVCANKIWVYTLNSRYRLLCLGIRKISQLLIPVNELSNIWF